nr:UPF0481 protein At3g47200-like [Arachis hypogaea]
MATPNPNDFVKKIEAMLEKGQARFTKECCIYTVPHNIRKLKEDAYTPEIASIGPFHHGDEKLLKMEDHKRLYCKQFIERSETNKLESFVNCMQELEPKIRACYSDDIKLSKEEHVMLILVDCCFILEFLLRYHFMLTRGDDAILFANTVKVPGRIIFPGDFKGELSVSNIGGIAHFPDLSRKLLLLSCNLSISTCSREAQIVQIYSATELKEAGVKFEVKKDSQCLLDLQLSGHTLRIPFFRVEDTTEVVLRNLLAFEQCHCINESYLPDYIAVLDFLINTEKDVDLLIKNGIIENWLGDSNAVAKMFNGLGANIMYPDFNVQYSLLFQRLNAFCARLATLRRDYCNTPWKTVALLLEFFCLFSLLFRQYFLFFKEYTSTRLMFDFFVNGRIEVFITNMWPLYYVIIEDHCIRQLPSL